MWIKVALDEIEIDFQPRGKDVAMNFEVNGKTFDKLTKLGERLKRKTGDDEAGRSELIRIVLQKSLDNVVVEDIEAPPREESDRRDVINFRATADLAKKIDTVRMGVGWSRAKLMEVVIEQAVKKIAIR